MLAPSIPGYDYGKVQRSPVTVDEFKRLQSVVGFTDDDRQALSDAGELFADEAEALVDGWRKIIGSQEPLSEWFFGPDRKPDDEYKAAVKPRFVQWVVDTFTRPFDQTWLDYQEEIALRHTPAKKNKTDGVQAPPLVPLRYVLAFAVPVIADMREHLVRKNLPVDEIERLHAAWTKAVILTLTLWSRPYTKQDLW
ncbi:MAG: protogloblin ApPgb [Alphaproteobacteria bacterium]|nr:protogloblin ApPgb [Alphaproteobacteria bacterium]